MGFLENLTNDAFANKMADHYHTHIGAAPFKGIRSEVSPGADKFSQPYIQRGIQDGVGIPSSNIDFFTAPEIDTSRVSRFMGSQKGLLFIAKQVGLQLSNPKGEFATTPLHGNRIYNPLATIAQIVANPLGIHTDRHALGPLNPKATNYEERIKAKTLIKSNRLVDIATDLKVGYFRDLVTTPKGGRTNTAGMTLIQAIPIILKESNFYLGGSKNISAMSGLSGPNSVFGIGRTTQRTSTTTGLRGLYQIHYKYGSSYKDMKSEGGQYVGAIGPLGNDKDYFFDLPKRPSGEAVEENKYKPPKDTTESGNPGDDSYTKLNPEGLYATVDGDDKFNPITIPSENEPNALLKYKTLDYGGITRQAKDKSSGIFKSFSKGTKYSPEELGQAAHGIIDYGNSKGVSDTYGLENDESDDYIPFIIGKGDEELKLRSYGLGSITDNTSFSWSEVKYAGRTMAMHKFDSVSRDVSHDLTIVAFTKAELLTNIEKVNKLYQMASPSINGSGYPSGAFLKFTLGDLYREQNVIMDKITFTVDDSTSWDLDLGHQLPMLIKLSLSYKLLTNSDGDFFTANSNYFGGSGGVDGLLESLEGFGS